jgi:IS605 OrfB family transposase
LERTNSDDSFKIVDKFCYQLTNLIKKSNKSSTNKSSIYINNKRKYEIGKLYCDLFKIINHYKCAYFAIEDLNFKSNNINENSIEFNRKTKNIWNLSYQQNLINKHCNINGIQLIEVNPCYSSFIGNILYNYFDPINASLEIGRRAFNKFKKGNKLFPTLTNTIYDAMSNRFETLQGFNSLRDVHYLKDCKNWQELYKYFQKTGIKYRRYLNELENNSFTSFSKDNIKSRVNCITFE